MSSAGRAANSNGCVSKPKEHATGLIGFAAQIRRSSLIGSCAMETAEHREPCESRGSRTDLGAPGGGIRPGDSTIASFRGDSKFRSLSERDCVAKHRCFFHLGRFAYCSACGVLRWERLTALSAYTLGRPATPYSRLPPMEAGGRGTRRGAAGSERLRSVAPHL